MKKYIPKTKAEFAAMCIRDYGFSEKLAKEAAAIVAGHGAFREEEPPFNGLVTPRGKIWKSESGKLRMVDNQGFVSRITRAQLYGIIEEMLTQDHPAEKA